MGVEKLVFYALSAVLIFASTMVISVRNSVRAALYLVLAFFTSAGLWLIVEAEFLAIALVLVYVGAVMVLFLFVVMMLDVDQSELREGFGRHLPLGLVVAAVIVLEIVLILGAAQLGDPATPGVAVAAESNVRAIASVLYTEYVYAFEIAAVILLIGIVAAISLTLRGRRPSRYVTPEEQLRARPEERVRLVNMPSARRKAGPAGD